MSQKWVYLFAEGGKEQKELLGGKGANLAEMTKAGMPVPPGFTISTEACSEFYKQGEKLPEGVWEQSLTALKTVEEQTSKKFGDATNPLLVSVRSGAAASMPGMMDTVLNLGLNPATVQGLAKLTNNERFAYDAYRRFIHMFANVVMGVEKTKFEKKLTEVKEGKGVSLDTDLDVTDLKKVIDLYFQVYQEETHEDFPTDTLKQLELSIKAVFGSWNNKRAIEYRRFNRLEGLAGTAVNIQAMVFGNMGDDSGTGVAFTRDPATGEKILYGEYLINAQGEDVVAGIRTPKKIAELEKQMPEVYRQFVEITQKLEKHYRDMQDLEFTIEKGKLYMLQTRNGKRTAQAAVKIAFEMVAEGLISKKEALMRVTPENVDQLLHPRLDPKAQLHVIAKGINASPGAASGKAVFDADKAADMGRDGEKVILVRAETNPDDIHGMIQAKGILTQHGGATSHAAVVARGIGKPCVAGCEGLRVDEEKREFKAGEVVVKEGDLIAINGSTGEVILGEVPMIAPEMSEDLKALLVWADEERKLGVWTNADYPRDAKKAREFGAEGIGLCRTEHMFFEEERRPIVVKMIMAETDEERQKCLDKLFEFQEKDFEGIFEVMNGLPVIIRLIDPPLHEFLPPKEQLIEEVTKLRCEGSNPAELAAKEVVLKVVNNMWEVNPMLGLRGCRVGITFKGMTEMQTRAIMEAACNKTQEGIKVLPKIEIPLVSHVNEYKSEKEKLTKVAQAVLAEKGMKIEYEIGSMIETPRAALTAGELANEVQFFSFGTNDLTQMTFGISRDDAEGKFLLKYVEDGLLPRNPFQTIDRGGVGLLMKMAVEAGRQVKSNLEYGICGEHGGDPESIEWCHLIGLNYVSCSPYRVPIARLAAAQAAIKHSGEKVQGAIRE